MITRGHVRRGLRRGGLVVGAAGLLGYLFSLAGAVTISMQNREFTLGGGAVQAKWSIWSAPVPGVAPPVPPRFAVSFESGRRWWWAPLWVQPYEKVYNYGTLVVPLWMPVLLGLVCGYLSLPEGFGPGRCKRCGYDVRALPAVGGRMTCPECGLASGAPDVAAAKERGA